MPNPKLSIVIPAYNERERLPPYLEDWRNMLGSSDLTYEILVVDDCGSDGTLEWLREREEEIPALRVLRNERNMGKGPTIRRAMLEARGDIRIFCDADGATPASELKPLLDRFDAKDWPIVIGCRIPLSGNSNVERKLSRHYTGRIFATMVSLLTGLHFYDTQCGFKMFSAEAAELIFSEIGDSRWAFDVEVLLLARKYGLNVAEVPVSWREVEGSKISMLRSAPKMLWEIARMGRKYRDSKPS